MTGTPFRKPTIAALTLCVGLTALRGAADGPRLVDARGESPAVTAAAKRNCQPSTPVKLVDGSGVASSNW